SRMVMAHIGLVKHRKGRQTMTDFQTIAEAYISAWNETDATRRERLLEKTFTSDVRYRDPLLQGDGHAGVEALIGGVHQQFPGFRFALKSGPDGFGDHSRFSWTLGPAGSESVIEGT